MKIRMTQSIRGSLNGVTVDDLACGQDYETENSPRGERMGRAHIANYAAIELDADGNPLVVVVVESVEPVATPEPRQRGK
jgi:hypothetical protein